MDSLQDYELQLMVDSIPYTDRTQWEQTRLQIYSNAQMWSKDKLKVTDILKFKWETPDEEEHKTTITDEEISALKNKVKTIEQWQNTLKN